MSIILCDNFPKFNMDLVTMQQQNALKRFIDRTSERENIAHALETKNPLEVDTPQRAEFRKALIDPCDGLAKERIIGKSDLFLLSYLEGGLRAGKPVCRIEVRDHRGRILGHGTGFLVSPCLLLTNNHILENADVARFSLAQFNYEVDLSSMPRQVMSFRFAPELFFMTDMKLDFTLVAVEVVSAAGRSLSKFGFLPLLTESGKALLGEDVSIIQHLSGKPKVIAIRGNKIADVFDDFIHYGTESMPASSGSPVFNDEWIVIALHHAGVPAPTDNTAYIANEGIRISSIMKFITLQRPTVCEDKQVLLDSLFNSISRKSGLAGYKPEKMLVAELRNEWYEGSTGYDPAFLDNSVTVPLPKLRSDLEQDIALLKNGRTVLNYTHFSIVMSKSRRLAYYTAVNIHGDLLVKVKRTKDKWYFDPRLEREYQCGPELYKNSDFTRGHLVRRRDPAWGELAKKANEDTFHFTNCSPQHQNLNQKTWLDLEDYILNNADTFNLKVTVFTGPVFRIDDMFYRGFQIPAEFWKVVVMVKTDGTLSATAYLQTQKNLLRDYEFAYGSYKTYQVSISNIENLTGLNFGDLRSYDLLGRIKATAYHLESTIVHVIENPEDIKL